MKTTMSCGVLFLFSTIALAQTPPWTVTLTPTLNPLPLGMCGAVHLTLLDPVTKDVPRNPQGYRISMADFDLTVSGGTSAAGHQIDASHFEACGCQGGAAGSTATVTARYPAQSLPAANRVPGVSIQQSSTFVLALPKGTVNPQSCATLAATPGNSSTAPSNPTTTASASPTGTAAPAPANGPAVELPTTGRRVPASTTPATTPVAATTPATTPVAAAPASGATPMTQPPAETVPASARTPGAVVPTTAVAPTTTPAAAAPVPVNPTGLVAFLRAPNGVLLMWYQVKDASFYVVFGPGLTPGGHRVENTAQPVDSTGIPKVQVDATNLPPGLHEWLVASYYSPGNVSTPSSQYSKATAIISAPATAQTPAPTAPAAAPAATSGKYLVTITGIRCYQASMDDMLSRDGVGDEVYAAAYVRRYDRGTGQLAEVTTRQSASHGDVNNFGGQRLQAGTRSATGGLRDADMVPEGALIAMRSVQASEITFPLRLWDGTLTDGVDALVISPSLWEQDVGDPFYAQWLQFQQTINNSLFSKQGVQDQISQKLFGAVVFGMSGVDNNTSGQSFGRLVLDAGMMLGGGGAPFLSLLSTTADRPLGIVQNGRDVSALPNHTVILTREIIEAALAKAPLGAIPSPVANGFGIGGMLGTPTLARLGVAAPKPGIVVIQFEDRAINGTLGFPERPAIYQMYIQVERVP
jgi:hypothetical protein